MARAQRVSSALSMRALLIVKIMLQQSCAELTYAPLFGILFFIFPFEKTCSLRYGYDYGCKVQIPSITTLLCLLSLMIN